jgi:hypothetical protein
MTDKPPATETNDTALAEGAIRGPEKIREAIVTLVRLGRRVVRLSAPHLDPAVFNTAVVADAIVAFAKRPQNRMQILLEDVAQVRRDNDRLIVLVRRLADAVELREVDDSLRGSRDLYLLIDRSACLVQEDVDRNDAVVHRAGSEAASRIARFDAAWDQASPVALRTLGL